MKNHRSFGSKAWAWALTATMLAGTLAGCGAATGAGSTARAPVLSPSATVVAAATVTSAAPTTAPQTDATSPAPEAYWPTAGWRTATPESQGMDGALLQQMIADITAQSLPLDSLLIVRHGYLVSETYFGDNTVDTRHELYSCTKSFTSTLFGIARDRGLLGDLSEPVLARFPGRSFDHTDARKEAMTLENLLTMTSGLGWTENDAAYRDMYMSGDWVDSVMDLRMREDPGAEFNYCSGCTHVLSAVVQEATGEDGVEFAREALLGPMGITDFGWDRDAAGVPIGGWGLQLTPRDMAKLGYLFLHDGQWDGQQIVSADWVRAATSPQVPVGGQVSYGYQWWIHAGVHGYAAEGRYGQTIFVCPSQDLIVVTTAYGFDNHDKIFELIGDRILLAITGRQG